MESESRPAEEQLREWWTGDDSTARAASGGRRACGWKDVSSDVSVGEVSQATARKVQQ